VFAVHLLSEVVAAAAKSMFRFTFSGGFNTILAKVSGVILFAGLLVDAGGFHELAHSIYTLIVVPIMLLGVSLVAKGAFHRR
jgi:hypothetical protein